VQESFNNFSALHGLPGQQAVMSRMPEPLFGLPLPPRFQQRGSGSNRNDQTIAGSSAIDAIAIDDDEDDDNTVAVPTPAIPPAPAPIINSHPRSADPNTPLAPLEPAHPSLTAPLQPSLQASTNGESVCAMCRKICGLDLRTCAEKHGGRKGLKDRIRKLNADGNGGGDAITALYEVYQAVSPFLSYEMSADYLVAQRRDA